jgi:ribonuclease P protein component
MDNRFRWSDRLHRRADFTTVFKKGNRYSSSGLMMWVYRRSESDHPGPRLGLAIPRAYGNAVHRNRLKRLLREVFRLNKSRLPGADMVFSSRSAIPKVRYQTVEPIVLLLWQKAKLIPHS